MPVHAHGKLWMAMYSSRTVKKFWAYACASHAAILLHRIPPCCTCKILALFEAAVANVGHYHVEFWQRICGLSPYDDHETMRGEAPLNDDIEKTSWAHAPTWAEN